MQKKIYLTLYIIAVIFAVFIIIGSKSKTFGRLFLATTDKNGVYYGDLYNMSEVAHFRFPITGGVTSVETSTIYNASVIAVGDSFFQSQLESKLLPSALRDATKMSVYRVPLTVEDPLKYLASINYQKGAEKIIIVESVERTAVNRALAYGTPSRIARADTSIMKKINDFNYKIFDTTDIDYFFKHNIFINPMRLFLKNLNFTLLGRIDRRIGAYSLRPPMLFYVDEVNFDKNVRNTDLVPKVADGIEKLGDALLQKYNLKMIYVVIPNKYTIYNYLDKQGSYNNFIPKLQTELKKRQLNYVDLYTAYMAEKNNGQLLYYRSDSHFTGLGKQILVDKLVRKITEPTNSNY